MKKFFTQKAFLLFTLFFVSMAAASFVAFKETEQVCTTAEEACKSVKGSEVLWEVVSRQFLSLVAI
jgi:hypothetical protein